MSKMPDPGESTARRNRSATITANHPPQGGLANGIHQFRSPNLASTPRNVTEPSPSVAAAALSSHLAGSADYNRIDSPGLTSQKRPRLSSSKTIHARPDGWGSPPPALAPTIPSAPSVPTRASLEYHDGDPLFPASQATLLLYTYRPNNLNPSQAHQPAPLPSLASAKSIPSTVHFSYSALPWRVQSGDYVEIRRIQRQEPANLSRTRGLGHMPPGPGDGRPARGEALKGIAKGMGRDTFVFRVGEDCPNVPINQIQVPETVAAAFKLQHRSEVEVVKMFDHSEANIDFVELRFSQYLGRADMWRLAMSLEGSTVHVGERISLAGGAVRAEVHGIWRNQHRHASGILTAKTKTIYRSKSAQVYLFIQLCQETWEFDEDGERYYEKVVHGFLPELFARWNEKGTSHLVTIILFARVHYTDEEVEYMEKNNIADGLMKDYAGRSCKDFFRVVIDFERRSDWNLSLAEIKRRVERSEREILLQYHVNELEAKNPGSFEQKRILGKWSFAYEGNVLEAVNLALNPFDEHYIDRDLSRTGLNIALITPGTGHFAVDKNLLRMTTERMIDHGNCLELICLTKMPLHSVPLFSYVSKRPKKPVWEVANNGVKTKPATPDLLYFDSHLSSATDCELADCYSIPKWVNSSYYSKTHDKPFRKDRFVPRCKMYEIQMLGILDHNLTTVAVPLLDMDDLSRYRKDTSSMEERKAAHDDFDANIFRPVIPDDGRSDLTPIRSRESGTLSTSVNNASYQSARLLAIKAAEEEKAAEKSAKKPADPPAAKTESARAESPVEQTNSKTAEASPRAVIKTGRSGSTNSRSPLKRIQELSPFDPLELVRTDFRAVSPAPSSLSMGKTNTTRPRSTSRVSELSAGPSSGQSSPKSTPARKLNTKSSKSSFHSRLGNSWLLTALSGRSQPSFPAAAAETVGRQDYISVTGSTLPSPISAKASPALPRPVPGAPIITPSTPTPTKANRKESESTQPHPSSSTTQPLPIASTRSRAQNDEEPVKSLRNSYKASKSPQGDSWAKAAAANFNRGKSHLTVNPCDPKENDDTSFGEGRRWQHVKPKPGKESQHLVKWTALTAPACLPLTTDFMPTTQEIQDFYELNSYDIACYPDQVSFLVRADAAHANLPLAVMREMASQRLSQNFQFITLPHTHDPIAESDGRLSSTRKVLLPGDSTKDGLKAGGASEVLRSGMGAIYLLWSNHIHRLAFDTTKQSVTVQRFVRKLRYSMDPVRYKCLVWPAQMSGYQQATAIYKYPNVEAKLNFNYLDRLIAGEEETLTANLRYWRTRYILIPSGRDPVAGVVPKGEQFNQNEILISGAFKVLEVIGKNQWKRESSTPDVPMRLLATTFDPSACVLDDGLMTELERLNRGEEQHPAGKALEGMTLQTVAEMMCQPNNGLVIRDRWWNFHVHEDSFTGEQFCDWLFNTFTDIKTIDEAAEWGRSLFDKGLIEHVTAAHGFFNYGHFFYRLRRDYDVNKSKRKRPAKGWFGGKPAEGPRDLLERHAAISATLQANEPLGKLGEGSKKHKRKIKMSQSLIIDLDPTKKSDRAEVAVLHADIIHNARNAFHFELNWLGVTAGLLDELRAKCAAQAERYGLRFVEAPVEQIKDQSKKCAYRAAIPIPLALAPPVVPDLHLRLAAQGVSAQITNWFEYAILTQKFGFVLDVEATSRYPDNVEVQYSYRGATPFEHSQFCHRSGLALVQCLGGTKGYLWSDNRLFIAAPTRGRGGGGAGTAETYPNMPVPARLSKQEEARALRMELEAFCGDAEGLKRFYEEITPPAVSPLIGVLEGVEGEKVDTRETSREASTGESNGLVEVETDGPGEKTANGDAIHEEKKEEGVDAEGNRAMWMGSEEQRSESPVDTRHTEEIGSA